MTGSNRIVRGGRVGEGGGRVVVVNVDHRDRLMKTAQIHKGSCGMKNNLS